MPGLDPGIHQKAKGRAKARLFYYAVTDCSQLPILNSKLFEAVHSLINVCNQKALLYGADRLASLL